MCFALADISVPQPSVAQALNLPRDFSCGVSAVLLIRFPLAASAQSKHCEHFNSCVASIFEFNPLV